MALWIGADSAQRQAITAASHVIDQRLKADPVNEGESRPNGRRITIVPPLAVRYRVEDDGLTVNVMHVQLFGRRKKN
jgi:hypothetical protein